MMSLAGPAGIFVAGAGLGLLGFAWRRQGGLWPLFLPGAVAFGLSIGREPFVVFLGLFCLPTVLTGIGALRRRVGSSTFAALAASDLALAAAFTTFHASTFHWSLPAAGWGPGAVLASAAGAARLFAPFRERSPEGMAMASLGWWQGLFLIWWAGGSAGLLLAAAGIAMWLSCLGIPGTQARLGLLGAGGVACLAMASGVPRPAPALFAAGAAGVGFALGERAVAIWTVAALPLSAAAHQIGTEEAGWPALLGAGIFTPALVAITYALARGPGTMAGGHVLAVAAVAAAAFVAAGSLETALWWVFGAAAAIGGSVWLTRPRDLYLDRLPAEPAGGPGHPSWLVAGWAVLGVGVLLAIRLTLLGASRGFL